VKTIPFSLPPIIERELRVAARRGATYWSRVGAGLSGIFIFFWVMTAQLAVMPAAVAGQITFRLLAGVAALTVLGSVLQLSSEAFAREKREDTLGLLFLTPLKPVDLVLGKLISTSLLAFYRFVAMIPLLALPILVGGVTAADYLLLVLGLANLVLLGATLGLYVSARTWDEKRAGTIAMFAMIGLAVLVPALVVGLATVLRWPEAQSLLALSPVFPVWQAMIPRVGGSGTWWASLLWTQVLGWIFFRAACRTLPLCWQRKPAHLDRQGEYLPQRRGEEPALQLTSGATQATTASKVRRSVRRQFAAHHRARLLDQNPILWLALRWRPDSTGAWIIGSVALVGCVTAFVTAGWRGLFTPALALFVFFCVNAGFKVFVATQASFAFARDRGDDTLQLLLSTPITSGHLVHGHLLAMRETLRPWIRRALSIEASWLALTIASDALRGGRETGIYAALSVALMGFLIPDLYAVGWTALWKGVIRPTAREAEKEAFMQVLFLPWLLTFIAAFLPMTVAGQRDGIIGFLVVWMVSSAAVNWWFGRRAFRKLYSELGVWGLRRSAGEFEHYDDWRRVGRRLGQWWRTRRETSIR